MITLDRAAHTSQRRPNGFTLVELLIVIVVIAILAAITIVAYNGVTQKAHTAALQSTLSQAATALGAYNAENGTYPDNPAAAKITVSDGTTLGYNGGSNYYCLSASNSSQTYFITNDTTTPQSGDCSTYVAGGTTSCPTGYIAVPGNPTFGTSDFCVMKWEAKNNGGNSKAVAVAGGTPWVSLSEASAASVAAANGSNYHLMTDPEWMTVAANVLSVPSNWSGGAVGSGYIYNGHVNNSPANPLAASTDDGDGLNGITGATGNGSAYNTKRTLTLTNGAVIWDFAGNVWEWTQGTITGNQPGSTADTGYNWHDWNATLSTSLASSSLPALSLPTAISAQAGTWNSTNGIGQLFSNGADAAAHVFLRGGDYFSTVRAGVLSLSLSNATTAPGGPNIGFRVAMSLSD